MSSGPVAYVVDDDPALCDSLCMLLQSVSIRCVSFNSGTELLRSDALEADNRSACLLADVRMPGLSGIALMERLQERGIRIPTIVITAYGDIPMAVRAMKLGAVDFVTKPFNAQSVLDLVQETLHDLEADPEAVLPPPGAHPAGHGDLGASTRLDAPDDETDELLQRYRTLSPREQQVFALITAGKSNQMVADDLGISVRTAEFHRARVMKKLKVQNLADLTLARVRIQQDAALELPIGHRG
jgi:two-component system response regulator FixJ